MGVWKRLDNRSWIIVALALMTMIALGNCSFDYVRNKVGLQSQIILGFPGKPKTFNPALAQDAFDIFSFMYEGLIRENGQGEIEPALAKSWQISADRKRITFTLREGLKWSDGEPLTGDDVVFTYKDIYLNEAIPTVAKDLLSIGKHHVLPTVRKLNALQVEFSTTELFAPLLRTTKLPILPSHVLKQVVNITNQDGNSQLLHSWGLDTPPSQIIVNGPYKLESYIPAERLTFRKNPYYWRKDKQGNNLPYSDRIVWEIISNTDTALIQFRSGSLDYINVLTSYFSLLKREEKQGKFTIYNGGVSPFNTFITFNLNQGSRNSKPIVDPIKSRWFNTLEFRQAIAHGIDRQRMLNNTFMGLGELTHSSFAVQSPYYLAPEDGLKVYEYNPQIAKALLLKAGFIYNSQGQLFDAQGHAVRFTLSINAGNKIREPMAVQIKNDLVKLGIQVDLQPLGVNLLLDKLFNTWDWEAIVFGINSGIEPNNEANVWLPQGSSHYFNQMPQPGQPLVTGQEIAQWEQKIGSLYVQAAAEFDEAKRKLLYTEAQQLMQVYLPLIYLVNPLAMIAVRNHIQGIQFSAIQDPLWNIYELKRIETAAHATKAY